MKKILYILVFLFSLFIINNIIYAWSEYKIGKEVDYNGIKFYVIKDSGTEEDSVVLLKKEPLTTIEVEKYGVDHVNMYYTDDTSSPFYKKVYDFNGYGGIQYYSSSTCTNYGEISGCKNDYASSEIKYVVDAWAKDSFNEGLIEARLITKDEVVNNLKYERYEEGTSFAYKPTESTPTWVYNNNYYYWTMSVFEDSNTTVWAVSESGGLYNFGVYNSVSHGRVGVVRPVVILSKLALGDTNDNKSDEKKFDKQDNSKQESITRVNVANTYLKQSIIVIIIGFIISCVAIVIYYIIKKKKGV